MFNQNAVEKQREICVIVFVAQLVSQWSAVYDFFPFDGFDFNVSQCCFKIQYNRLAYFSGAVAYEEEEKLTVQSLTLI